MTTSWSFDDVDLSTFGKITLLDDYLDQAAKRGGNQVVPFRHGTVFVPKFYDETEIVVGIAMKYGNAELLEQAIDDLKTLCSSRSEKVLSNTRADGSVRTAMASVEGKLQAKRESYNFARVVITFKLADPFFRGETQTSETLTVDVSPKAWTVTNAGTVEECNPTIVMTGPLDTPVITNSNNGCVFTYGAAIASPRVVTVSLVDGEIVATDDLGANKIANVEHEGSESLLVLEPGDNVLSVTDDLHTTGTIQIKFYPPYL